MADAVTTTILEDGAVNAVVRLTNLSDATGEAAVTKVTAASLSGAPAKVKIEKIIFQTSGGMRVNVLWGATADVLAATLPADISDELDFRDMGGLINNAGAGVTGNIKFTTVGAAAGSAYMVLLYLKKKY